MDDIGFDISKIPFGGSGDDRRPSTNSLYPPPSASEYRKSIFDDDMFAGFKFHSIRRELSSFLPESLKVMKSSYGNAGDSDEEGEREFDPDLEICSEAHVER